MSIESIIFQSLRGLVADRVYPDFAPEGADRPYITYQRIGGKSINFYDKTLPSKANGNFQISVWADTRAAAVDMATGIEAIMRAVDELQPEVLSQPMAMNDEVTKLRGSVQDFSFWN